MPAKDRRQPWLTLLAEERDLAEPVLEALWFQLFDRDIASKNGTLITGLLPMLAFTA